MAVGPLALRAHAQDGLGVRGSPPQPPPGRPKHWTGLRARAVIAAGGAALAVAVTLSVLTGIYVRAYLLSQRDRVTLRQAYANARVVRDRLRERDPGVNELLSGLRAEPGGSVLLRYNGRWYSPTVGTSTDWMPASVVAAVTETTTGRQRVRIATQPYQVVVVGLPEVEASYVELFPLTALQRTLDTVRNALVLGSAVAAGGGMFLGVWSSDRALRPLRRVADAAVRLSEGGLDVRLPPESDPDLARLVDSFNTMADAVQGRIEREVQFAADVSHELRTPLTAIRSTAEVLERRRDELPERAREALDVLLRKVVRFDRLTQDLLELSRMDAGADRSSEDESLVDEFVARVVQQHAPGVPVEAAARVRDHFLVVDRRRLERVLANLLDNARIHAGGATRVSLSRSGPHLVISVDDAGPGLGADERSAVFERFRRGAGSSQRPGSGLGLSLVSEHVARMGGEVALEDRSGGGTRAVVRLPWRDAS